MRQVEQATTKIAKRIAKQLHGSDALWQMYLMDVYEEYYRLLKDISQRPCPLSGSAPEEPT
jgi:hypothetical protein